MNYLYILIPFLCGIVLIIFLIKKINRKNKVLEKVILEKREIEQLKKGELKEYFNEEWEVQQKELNNKFKLKETELGGRIGQLEATLKEKEKRYTEVNQDLDLYREGKIKEIDSAAAEYEQRKQLIVDQSIEKYRNFQIEHANNKMAVTKEEIDKVNEELTKLLEELEVERRKRAAVNEEIRRARALEEQEDFYRIQIDPNDKDDVEILRSVAPRLRHPEAINKVIWTGYYQKPLAELRKRLLPNGDVSCVYMATRLKTGEVYVGQTTSFDKRLQEHTRSALGIGTLASSTLHRKMAEDGPEHFLWSILEEVPKDKLRERESYYIDFYDSKNYGLNTISGDKK